jgi:hypothetical protein
MKKSLKDVSGTTLALTSLALMGAAAVVSAPVWIWYRRKRKKTDSMAGTPPPAAARADVTAASESAPAERPPDPPWSE